MQSLVLIHGAFTGGWIWRRVLPLLRREGFDVHAPTLTGFGERSHLLTYGAGPATALRDLGNFIYHEKLRDMVVLGHSLGGATALALAERMPELVRGVVLLDGLFPAPGESAAEAGGQTLENLVRANAEGWLVRPWSLPAFDIHREDDKAWFSSLLCPTPRSFFMEPFLRAGLQDGMAPYRLFVQCGGSPGPVVEAQAERARAAGFAHLEMCSGHCPMVTMPFALSEALAPWLREQAAHSIRRRRKDCAAPSGLFETRRLRHACPNRRGACSAQGLPTEAMD